MPKGYCEDCGTKTQNGFCPNCHEERVILDQYFELDMTPPAEDSEFMKKAREQERDVARKSNQEN